VATLSKLGLDVNPAFLAFAADIQANTSIEK
jgi:hypothetical protein